MTQPPVPDVPYGGADPLPGSPPPRWLRRLVEEHGPPEDTRAGEAVLLAEPPRAVPLSYRLCALTLGPWVAFTVVLLVTAPLALWVASPLLRTLALAVGVAGLALVVGRRYARRTGILRWGRVATVVRSTSRTTSTSFTNWPMRQARGWEVTTSLFTGGGTVTDVDYTVDARPGRLRLRGLPYVDGVVLADPRRPERAMAVSQLPHSVKPRPDGQFSGWLAPVRWAWVVTSLLVEVGLVALLVWSVSDLLG